MTCNPNWQEIKIHLPEAQTENSSLDIVSGVLLMKMKHHAYQWLYSSHDMMSEATDNEIFGSSVAHLRVVESQKIGSPHANCICFLNKADKEILRYHKH